MIAEHPTGGGAMMPMSDGRFALKFRILEGETETVELERVDLATGQPAPNWAIQRFENSPGTADPSFTKLLVQTDRTRCGLFDLVEGRLIWNRPRLGYGQESAVFSPDGRSIALRGRRVIQFLEASTGKLRYSIPSLESQRPLAFTPDGRYLAAIGPTAPLYLWDVHGLLRTLPNRLDASTTKTLWKDLLADDAQAAFRALQRLAAAPETTLPFVRERVRPAVAPEPEKWAEWLRSLDAPAFRDREAAMKELKKVAETIAGELRAARAATTSLEVHERLSKILAMTYPESLESVRRTRILELVEWCGTSDAKALLKSWSASAPGSLLATEAKVTLARLR